MINMCEYDESFTWQEMYNETDVCFNCKVNNNCPGHIKALTEHPHIAIDISHQEITAMKAALFALRKSRELKYGGTFVENIRDDKSARISFYDAEDVMSRLIYRIEEGCK